MLKRNSLVFPNGKLVILRINMFIHSGTGERDYVCSPLCDTTIDSVEAYDEECWVTVDPWVSIDVPQGRFVGGDGTMGNEGFIAHTDKQDQLIWGLFFEQTNPIKQLFVEGHTLRAVNEHGELKIVINLQDLTDIHISTMDNCAD